MDQKSKFTALTFSDFIDAYPFITKGDEEIASRIFEVLNSPAAFELMAQRILVGQPAYAGVARLLDLVLADKRERATCDHEARVQLRRLNQISGAIVKAVVCANGGEMISKDGEMPADLLAYARTAACFRLLGPAKPNFY